jgi:guanylate kinase
MFLHLIKEEAFIEYAEFSGNLYGTSRLKVDDVFSISMLRCIHPTSGSLHP